jgi:antirestriction protein ArdC
MSAQTVARQRFTDQERAEHRQARRAEQRRQIERAARELLTSEGWRCWVQTRAKFHRYSFNNCMLIALQAPEATQVAGFRAWQQLGRRVRKGERSIKIMAPMGIKEHDADGQETGERIVFFRSVPVFDIAQTDGEPLREIPREPITGDSHAHLLEPLTAHARSLGFSVDRESLEHAGGYCDARARRIVLSTNLGSANAQVRVLVHELAHAHGVSYKDYGREDAAVIVETAAVIACGALGLDTSGESIPYIAGWGERGDLEAIRKHAETVDQIARELEQACGLNGPSRNAAGGSPCEAHSGKAARSACRRSSPPRRDATTSITSLSLPCAFVHPISFRCQCCSW